MRIEFIPFERFEERLRVTKSDSDFNYFFDLMLYGEYLTKIIACGLAAAINENKDRVRYGILHALVRSDGLGDWSRIIDEMLIGPTSEHLTSNIREVEQKELNQRSDSSSWQFKAVESLLECYQYFDLEAEKLKGKVAARSWFSAFVYLRNKTRAHGAMTSSQCSGACIPLESSIRYIISNYGLFDRQWVFLSRNLSGKYRVTKYGSSDSQFTHLKKENDCNYENGVYLYYDSIRKVDLVFSNSEALDFYLPNGNFTPTTFEALSYITDKKPKYSSKEYLIPATELPSSETEGYKSLEVINNSFSNLPSLKGLYISRKKLENDLLSILNETERYPVVTLVGRGGIGKTSLALSVLHEITKYERFGLILWFSARDVDLLMEGPKLVKTQILTELDISKEATRLLEPIGGHEKGFDHKGFFSEILQISELGNALFVFDNFETVKNPIELFEWLNTYIRNPNKILITSRISRNFKADYPIEVQGMNEDECRELIHRTSIELGIEGLVTEQYIESLISESRGHPYIIKILLGEVAKTGKSKKVERIVAASDELLTALFRRTYQTLSPVAKRIFLTLASWRSVVPQIALESVMLRPEQERMDIESAVEELRTSSLIEVIESDRDGTNFLSVPLAASIFGYSEYNVSPNKIAINSDKDLLMEFGAAKQTDIRNGFAPRIERKFRIVAKSAAEGKDIKKELPVLEYIASKYPRAWTYLADISLEQGKSSEAKRYIREYIKTNPSDDEKLSAWTTLAELCQGTSDWDGESHALSEVCLLPNIGISIISDVANRVNRYYFENPITYADFESKELIVKKIAEVLTKVISDGNATDYSRLAWLHLHLKNKQKAITFTEKGLEIDPENVYCIRLAKKFGI